VWKRSDVNTYLSSNNLIAGSWCGSQKPSGTWVSGDFSFALDDYKLPSNRVAFGTPVSSSNCAASVGAQAVLGSDSGFLAMANNAASVAYKNDFDMDGIADKSDQCVAQKTNSQTDSDSDGIGDYCEPICYVSPSDPEAPWYDSDGDGLDDYCDNSWQTYNPAQY
jgi:hypothetical protein